MFPTPRPRSFAAVLLLAAATTPTAAHATVLTPKPAGLFRDSVGVNTHLNFVNTPYTNSQLSTIQDLIQGLGILHVRDYVCPSTDAGCTASNDRLANLFDLRKPRKSAGGRAEGAAHGTGGTAPGVGVSAVQLRSGDEPAEPEQRHSDLAAVRLDEVAGW